MTLTPKIRNLTQQLNRQTQLLAKERQSRHRLESALCKSEENLARVMRLNPLAMMITTQDDRIVEVNPSFCQLLGYTPRKLSKTTHELNLWTAGSRNRWCQMLDTVGTIDLLQIRWRKP